MRIPSVILIAALLAAPLARAGVPINETLPPAFDVIALFEFDGNTLDSSGNNRDATLIGGNYVSTRYGSALRVTYEDIEGLIAPVGIDWSPYAGLLVHPYTVEIVFTPSYGSGYNKLFSHDDSSDSGWYYRNEGFTAYPSGSSLGEGLMREHQLLYLAIVSTGVDEIEVFFNGASLGTGPKGFTGSPAEAIFFRDDDDTSRNEQLNATIEVLRISDVARSAGEIAAIASGLPFYRDGFETPDP